MTRCIDLTADSAKQLISDLATALLRPHIVRHAREVPAAEFFKLIDGLVSGA